jgi:hypothetical protein
MDLEYDIPLLNFNDFFTINAIINMELEVSKYKYELKTTCENNDEIDYKITLFKMKYLEKPEIYKKLTRSQLEQEKQIVTAKFREILDRRSRNRFSSSDKKIEDELYS